MNHWNSIAACSVATLVLTVAFSVGCGHRAAVAPSGAACNNQPNMAAGLDSLRNAKASLDVAEHDKGGWRDNAIQATNNAIAETERGCASADD